MGSGPYDDWHLQWPYQGCTAFKWPCTAIPTKGKCLGPHVWISQLICTYLCELNLVQPRLSFLPLDTIPSSDGSKNFSVPSNWRHVWGTCKAHGRLSSRSKSLDVVLRPHYRPLASCRGTQWYFSCASEAAECTSPCQRGLSYPWFYLVNSGPPGHLHTSAPLNPELGKSPLVSSVLSPLVPLHSFL